MHSHLATTTPSHGDHAPFNPAMSAAIAGAMTLASITQEDDQDFEGCGAQILMELEGAFTNTDMETEFEPIAWGIVNAFHRQKTALESRLDTAQVRIRAEMDAQDGSEVKSLELERATDTARTLEAKIETLDSMVNSMADIFKAACNRPWTPRNGTKTRRGTPTAAVIDAQRFMRERRRRTSSTVSETPPLVLFSGGQDYGDPDAIFNALDRARTDFPGMVLGTTAQKKGADLFAERWAESRNVTLIPFEPDFQKWGAKRAPFKRNEKMIEADPHMVIIFPGRGVTLNLGQKATQDNIEVRDHTG